MNDQNLWDERYRSSSAIWSGDPNPQLVSEVSGLTPGSALDVGCGEGADAIWLTEHGWHVTAVDISSVALEHARAAEVNAHLDWGIDWRHVNVVAEPPPTLFYDLISAQFMHLLPIPREVLFRGLAEAVKPGGTLLIVGHDPSDLQTTARRPPNPEVFYTAAHVAELLPPQRWEIVATATRARSATDPTGQTITVHDAVLRARKRE